VRYGDPQSKRHDLQRIQWIADVKGGEFEGMNNRRKELKRMSPPLLNCFQQAKNACPVTGGRGSRPVAPVILIDF
jgi:hypothetical protein